MQTDAHIRAAAIDAIHETVANLQRQLANQRVDMLCPDQLRAAIRSADGADTITPEDVEAIARQIETDIGVTFRLEEFK